MEHGLFSRPTDPVRLGMQMLAMQEVRDVTLFKKECVRIAEKLHGRLQRKKHLDVFQGIGNKI